MVFWISKTPFFFLGNGDGDGLWADLASAARYNWYQRDVGLWANLTGGSFKIMPNLREVESK